MERFRRGVGYLQKQLELLEEALRNRVYVQGLLATALFILANAVKISLFNYFLLPSQNVDIFKYKLMLTLWIFILLYSLILSFKSKWVFIGVYLVQTLYILVSLSYYLFYHSYLHVLQWFALFREGFDAAKHLASPSSVQLLVVLIDLPFALYLCLRYFRPEVFRFKLRFFKVAAMLAAVFVVFWIEADNYVQGYSLVQYMGSRYAGETPIVERYGTVVNSVVSIAKNIDEKQLVGQLQYGKAITAAAPVVQTDRPNFVMIQVESMDANVVNQQYKNQYIAPFLHSLSGNSIYFPYMLSYHKGGGTSDSEFSTLNSLESLEAFPAQKLANYDYPNSLVSRLASASYSTLGFHGNAGTFFNRDVAFPRMGFQKLFDMSEMNLKDVGWGAPDSEVFHFVEDKLSGQQQPFFSYVITMTSHGPFTNARNYYNNPLYDDISDTTVRDYFNSMSYVDQSIGDFVAKIRASCPNTYIFIWGDHTPNIQTGLYQQASFMDEDRYLEYVPLFILTPNQKVYQEKTMAASFLDISPTVLYASGIPFTVESDGIDLLKRASDSGTAAVGTVPFKGVQYDRQDLYNKVKR